jgi:hypothetical protein
MAANTFILVFCGFMAWLLYRFKLSKAVSRTEVQKLLPFFFVLGVFFLFNALFAFMGQGGLELAIKMEPVTLLPVLEDTESGDGVILDGVVSANNSSSYREEYVVYIDDTHLWSPSELLIELEDGTVAISNDTYARRNWFRDGRSYLKANDPVIIVGKVERSVSLLGENKGETHLSIHADLIYVGEHADFVAHAKQRILFPTGMLAANLIGAVVVIVVPMVFWLKRDKHA